MTVRQCLAGFAVAGVLLGSASSVAAAPARKRAARSHTSARKTVVDLNSASKARLTSLPGVDAEAADKIIAGRPYASSNDLVSKHVLPDETFAKIKGQVTARKPATGKRGAAKKRRRAARKTARRP